MAVLERTEVPNPADPVRKVRHYAVRHLERLPPATPYPEVFTRLKSVFADPSLKGSHLVADYTGVGQPVLDMLRKAKVGASVTPLLVTNGKRHTSDERGGWYVPRRNWPRHCRYSCSRGDCGWHRHTQAAILVKELAAFQLKVTATQAMEMDAWREGRTMIWCWP